MSFSRLPTELILEIVAHVHSDALLNFALTNKRIFAIIMPKVIAAQSARVQQVIDAHDLRGRMRELNKTSYTSYWLHDDCLDNVFADSYRLIHLRHKHTVHEEMYKCVYALIRRAPRITKIFIDTPKRWLPPPEYYERISNLFELCSHKSPAPEIYILDTFQGIAYYPADGPFLNPVFVRGHARLGPRFGRKALLKIISSLAHPFAPIPSPQDNKPTPRQPPRVSTKPFYRCSCVGPSPNIYPVEQDVTLQKISINSEAMFTPSLYQYTMALLNVAPLTALIIHCVDMSPAAWSQTLYALKLPNLAMFVLERIEVRFLDVMFFLQRHPGVVKLSLFIGLLPEDSSERMEFPAHFVLPSVTAVRAWPEYADILLDGQYKDRLPELKKLAICGVTNPAIGLCRVFNSLLSHSATMTVLRLQLPFQETGLLEWVSQYREPKIVGVKTLITTGATELNAASQSIIVWYEQVIHPLLSHRLLSDNRRQARPVLDTGTLWHLRLGILLFTVFPDLCDWSDDDQLYCRSGFL